MILFNFAASPGMFRIRMNHRGSLIGDTDGLRSPKACGESWMAGVGIP